MYTKCFKKFRKFVAVVLALSFVSLACFGNTLFTVSTLANSLTGQELLQELRTMGLGKLNSEVPTIPGDTTGSDNIPVVTPGDTTGSDNIPVVTPGDTTGSDNIPVITPGDTPGSETIPSITPGDTTGNEAVESPEAVKPLSEGGIALETNQVLQPQPAGEDNATENNVVETTESIQQPVTTPGNIQVAPEYTREMLVAYVQLLTGEQVISLDETDITTGESQELYSMLTPEQLQAIDLLRNPIYDMTDAGPLMPPVTMEGYEEIMPFSLFQEDSVMLQSDTFKTPPDGLKLNKTATWEDTNKKAKITLEAYTTGTVSAGEKAIPADIVLVLDQSGSMVDGYSYQVMKRSELDKTQTYKWKNKGNEYFLMWRDGKWKYSYALLIWSTLESADPLMVAPLKMDVLKSAVNKFIDQVEANAKTKNVDHRIAIVSFANEAFVKSEFKNTLITQDVASLKASVNDLSAEGNTHTDKGMATAKTILEKDSYTGPNKQRNRVVIMFTDGEPYGGGDDFDQTIAQNAIAYSRILKAGTQENVQVTIKQGNENTVIVSKGLGTTVYDIGIFSGADATSTTSNPNKFMNYVSTNYINATSMTNGGQRNDKGNYYLTASNQTGLEKIFQSISEQIVAPTVPLGANAVIRDDLSSYFGTPKNIKVYTQNYIGTDTNKPTWGNRTELNNPQVSLVDKTIRVNGFNFNDNYLVNVNGTAKGKKIIIEFETQPIAGFIGGNKVPTNGPASGIYAGSELVGNFARPVVDIPLNYNFTPTNQSIYITNTVENPQNFIPQNYTQNSSTTVYNWGGMRNDFVKIVYTVKDGLNNTVGTYTVSPAQPQGVWAASSNYTAPSLRNDTAYTVSCDITPTQTNTITPLNITKNPMVYIFTPAITCKDSSIYLGTSFSEQMRVDSVKLNGWAYRGTVANVPGMTPPSTPPVLVYDYVIANNTNAVVNDWWLERNTDFKVKVKVGTTDITDRTLINKPVGTTSDHDFTVEVKTCTLKIQKQVVNPTSNVGDESFIFNVNRTGLSGEPIKFQDKYKSMQVVITGPKTVTITGLPIGRYTVEENGNWSWRYSGSGSQSATFSGSQDNYTAIVTNTSKNNKWLTFEGINRNVFNSTIGVPK